MLAVKFLYLQAREKFIGKPLRFPYKVHNSFLTVKSLKIFSKMYKFHCTFLRSLAPFPKKGLLKVYFS